MKKVHKPQTLQIPPKTLTFYRSSEQVNNLLEALKDSKQEFKVHQSQYSTVIEVDGRKTRYVTQTYEDNVFKCSAMIRGNLNKSTRTQEILDSHFSTLNYNSKAGLEPGKYGKAINIDISGAYPQCLINNELIDDRTYRYLMDLDKKERLPAIGMIAKKSMIFHYKGGELLECVESVGKYTKVFQFIVQEINEIMKACIEIAGDFYIMHWVDGIFLKKFTPKIIVNKIQEYIISKGYKLKFEKIDRFNLSREDVFINIDMKKNGQIKTLRFADRNMVILQNTITAVLNGDLSNLHGSTTRNIQSPGHIPHPDLAEWFS